ncbi:MAG: alpha/beta fold hydrolase [Deltaproteobacteria bacterium]|uniref:alpha/beta fold hydrolase n=1 Tax=Desulfobacula sp. TaxID=2593537 RepID=UPI0019CBF50B|nr:alpha/beta fold hydrolase [Candidatus Desulfobacula maris]MBL6995828.1 alpha/beta fold hydrolase [Desulfobacula sp.]
MERIANQNQGISFPVGYFPFNKNKVFNYQLNRWHSLGFLPKTEIEKVSLKIKTFNDWKLAMDHLGDKAEQEKRFLNAAFYRRAAEFYLTDDLERKERYYDIFVDLFNNAIGSNESLKDCVPYDGGNLYSIQFKANGIKKGTLLIHGGFDSFLEEWYFIMKSFAGMGYDVIGFEGPGQGGVLLKQGIPLDYQWEKPVSAILNYYNINEASIMGLSMGGWFCLRAAAFEPRIKNVIASGHAVDYSHIPPAFARMVMMFFIKYFRTYTAKSFKKVSQKEGIQGWQTSQLAHITKRPPLEAFEYSLNLNKENLHCERITQNVLYLTGKNDHFIPFKMHDLQIKLLTNVNSLTDRVYTKEEHADNHCQIGNISLMIKDCFTWLNSR